MDTDTLSIVGPPDVVTLVTETGATGPRGSLWFTGAGMPSSLTIPDYDSLKVGDMYVDQNDGGIYQMILLPSNALDWIKVGVSAAGGSLDTEGVQDVVGAMVAAAGGTYNDAAGTITLPSVGGGGATRGLIITDTNVGTIPAGDSVDNLAAYYNSGTSAITVQGTSIAAGTHAVWAWVSSAWVLLSSSTGGGEPSPLAVPTCSISSVTSSSITIAYSTTTPGAASWQYRLDGGSAAALDGTSPDTIGGLSPVQTGTIEVRYAVGAVWSAWSSPVAWETASLSLSWLQMPVAAGVTESWSDTHGWTYTWTGTPKIEKVVAQAGQDYQLTFRVATAPSANAGVQVSGAYGTVGNVGDANNTLSPISLSIYPTTWSQWGGIGHGAPLSYAAGDMWRISRTGTIYKIETSTDMGDTWSLRQSTDRGTNYDVPWLSLTGAAGLVINRLQLAVVGTPLTVTTPVGPIALNPGGGASDTILIPGAVGVDYKISGNTVTGLYAVPTQGATVTVLPVPQAGYCLYKNILAATGWTYTFSVDAVPDSSSAPAMASVLTSDSFNRADGAPGTSDVYAGGTARTWTVNTAGTAITSNALSITVNGATIGGWAATASQQVEWDVTSAATTSRIKIAEGTWLQVVSGAASLWHTYQAGSPYGVFTRAPVVSLSGTGTTGRWIAKAAGRVITILKPAGSGPSARIILPYALMNGTNVDFAANTWSSSWGLVAEVGDLLIDNVKIGIPA